MRHVSTAFTAALIVVAASGCTSVSGSGDSTALTALAPVSQPPLEAPADQAAPLSSEPGQGLPAQAIAETPVGADNAGAVAAASPSAGSPIAFAAVIGAPDSAMEPLSLELASRARQRGIAVTGADSIGDGHILKGYFSTLDEGSTGGVVYVWDVVDASGKRVYRIQGQQALRRGGNWNSVPDATMRAIADDTIDQLAGWLTARSG